MQGLYGLFDKKPLTFNDIALIVPDFFPETVWLTVKWNSFPGFSRGLSAKFLGFSSVFLTMLSKNTNILYIPSVFTYPPFILYSTWNFVSVAGLWPYKPLYFPWPTVQKFYLSPDHCRFPQLSLTFLPQVKRTLCSLTFPDRINLYIFPDLQYESGIFPWPDMIRLLDFPLPITKRTLSHWPYMHDYGTE